MAWEAFKFGLDAFCITVTMKGLLQKYPVEVLQLVLCCTSDVVTRGGSPELYATISDPSLAVQYCTAYCHVLISCLLFLLAPS